VVIAPNVCFSTAVSVSGLRIIALETCAIKASYMKDATGFVTKNKARVQVVIINALSKAFVRMTRRAHDKIIVVDG
jgi:hypothetical protein